VELRRPSFGLVLLIIATIFAGGCGGGGTTPPPPTTLGIEDALKIPLPTTVTASPSSSSALQMLIDWQTSPPLTATAVSTEVNRAATYATSNPNEAGAQLALCLAMLYWGNQRIVADLGYNLSEQLLGVVTGDLPGQVRQALGQALSGSFVGVDFSVSSAQADEAPIRPQTGLTPSQVQASVRNNLLYVLYNTQSGKYGVLQRLTALGGASTGTRLVRYTYGGQNYALYAADFQALTALDRCLRGALLSLTAYNLDKGSFTPATAPWHNLAVGSAASPSTYLPLSPYLTLNTGGSSDLITAIGQVRLALAATGTVLTTHPGADPEDLISRVLVLNYSQLEITQRAADLGELMAATGVTTRVDWRIFYEGSGWVVQTPVTGLFLKPSRVWDVPLADLKSFFPILHVVLQGGDKVLEFQGAADVPDATLGGCTNGTKTAALFSVIFCDEGLSHRYQFQFTSTGGRTLSLRWPMPYIMNL
jgi:hypothetical protein